MADRCYSPPSHLTPPYKKAPWYILIEENVPRQDDAKKGPANMGDLFNFDREIGKTKAIMRCLNSSKVTVEWKSSRFAPLNDQQKELLEAIQSPKTRIVIYNDEGDYLQFGCGLNIGDQVQVSHRALNDVEDDVHGVLRYRGSLKRTKSCTLKGTYFGVALSKACGESNGRFFYRNYFECIEKHGVLVTVADLVPVPKRTSSHQADQRIEHNPSESLGTENLPRATMLTIGSEVEARVSVRDATGIRIAWVRGKIEESAEKDGKIFYAVKTGKEVVANSHGMYKGTSIFKRVNTTDVATVPKDDIREIQACRVVSRDSDGEKPYIYKEPESITTITGRPIFLECAACGEPDPKYIWYKLSSEETWKPSGKEIKWDSAKGKHSGTYYCAAYNQHGTVHSREIVIKVNSDTEPPHIWEQPRSVKTSVGKLFFLECKASGKPEPKYVWKKVQDNGDFQEIEAGMKLQCNQASLEHSGNYQCWVSNDVGGVQSKQVTVQVKDKSGDSNTHTYAVKAQHSVSSIPVKHPRTSDIADVPLTFDERHFGEASRSGTEESKKDWLISKVTGWMGVGQPLFPLKHSHLVGISDGGLPLLQKLAADLGMKDSRQILEREADDFHLTRDLLRKWWDEDLHEGHREQFKKFQVCLVTHGYGEIVNFIKGDEPTHGDFDDSVKGVVLHWIHGKLIDGLAEKLGIKAPHADNRLPDYEHGELVFKRLNEIYPGSRKLKLLIEAIKSLSQDLSQRQHGPSTQLSEGLHILAMTLEQGLPEETIREIATSVPRKQSWELGNTLGLSRARLAAFDERYPQDFRRCVFEMLRYWQMIQKYSVDQCERLTIALKAWNIEGKIHLLTRGVDEECLLSLADCISDSWKELAPFVCRPPDMQLLIESTDRNHDKALQVLRTWKRKQPFTSGDLKDDLYQLLVRCKLEHAARQLHDGLDPTTLWTLAVKLVFDWQPLGVLLGFSSDELRPMTHPRHPSQAAYAMLEEWNKRHRRDKRRLENLCHALQLAGLGKLAEWLRQPGSGYCPGDEQLEALPGETSSKYDHDIRNVDKKLMEDISKLLKVADADVSLLKEFLDIQKDVKKSATPHRNDPYFNCLMTWRRKMNNYGLDKKTIGEVLIKALGKCGMDKAALLVSDGSRVDPQQGAKEAVANVDLPHRNFRVSSMVEFDWGGRLFRGSIQSITVIPELQELGKIAGIETEEYPMGFGTDGTFGTKATPAGRIVFMPISRCRADARFPTEEEILNEPAKATKEDFGGIHCEPVEGYMKPPQEVKKEHLGMFKGIQGDHNSCYMDVTLYSMFAYTTVFDGILGFPPESEDLVQEVKNTLRESIVNPLRTFGVVRADFILGFREMLNQLSSMKGLRTEEKDPEEFIHTLVHELLKAKPYLQISQGNNATMESFIYQIFLDKKEYLRFPTVEQLVQLSFLESDLKLMEVPECFIVQLPRFGKKFKLYDWILPSLEMDITNIIQNTSRECVSCGKLAFLQCKDCRPVKGTEEVILNFCGECWDTTHKHPGKSGHKSLSLSLNKEFVRQYMLKTNNDQQPKPDLHPKFRMELFAVMCIETSHYVCFVKTGDSTSSDWVFFDSMADRRGDHSGYNVPEVMHLLDFKATLENSKLEENLHKQGFPGHYKRLLGDAYICFYRLMEQTIDEPLESSQSTVTSPAPDKVQDMECDPHTLQASQEDDQTPQGAIPRNALARGRRREFGSDEQARLVPTPQAGDSPMYENRNGISWTIHVEPHRHELSRPPLHEEEDRYGANTGTPCRIEPQHHAPAYWPNGSNNEGNEQDLYRPTGDPTQ